MGLASLVLPLPSCVTVDMLLKLSVLLFADLQNVRGSIPGTQKVIRKSECPFLLPPKARQAPLPTICTHWPWKNAQSGNPTTKLSVAPYFLPRQVSRPRQHGPFPPSQLHSPGLIPMQHVSCFLTAPWTRYIPSNTSTPPLLSLPDISVLIDLPNIHVWLT